MTGPGLFSGLVVLSSGATPPAGFVPTGAQIFANTTDGRLRQAGTMPLARTYASAASVNQSVYVIGGAGDNGNPDGYSNLVQAWVPSTNEWYPYPRMKFFRRSLGVVAIGRFLYAMGGWFNGRSLPYVERLDIDRLLWDPLPDMPFVKSHFAIAAVDAYIYLFAGYDNATGDDSEDPLGVPAVASTDAAWAYNISTKQWSRVASCPKKLMNPSGVAVGRKIYVIGGFVSDSLESPSFVYDVDKNLWSAIPSPDPYWWWPGVTAINGIIYAFGGVQVTPTGNGSTAAACAKVARYDPALNAWETLPPVLVPARSGVAVTSLGGTAYVIGGMDVSMAVPPPAIGSCDALTPGDLTFNLYRKT